MTGYEAAMTVLISFGVVLAVAALLTVRNLDRIEREIAARKASEHPAE